MKLGKKKIDNVKSELEEIARKLEFALLLGHIKEEMKKLKKYGINFCEDEFWHGYRTAVFHIGAVILIVSFILFVILGFIFGG